LDLQQIHQGKEEEIKVFDSLIDVLCCLRKNRNENIILLPKEKSKSLINALDAESLAVALSGNESLVSLALEEIHLSSLIGIHRFASALMKHTSIQRLTLYGNKLRDEGVLTLLNASILYAMRVHFVGFILIIMPTTKQLPPNPLSLWEPNRRQRCILDR
jgi:hypothetical protein